VGANKKGGLHALPGTRPPEVEVFECTAVKAYLKDRYDVDMNQIAIQNPEMDHHDLPDLVAKQAELGVDTLNVEVIRIYLESLTIDECSELIAAIRELA
jgi:hypothetical protein